MGWYDAFPGQESLQDPTNWIITEARKRRQANEQPKGKAGSSGCQLDLAFSMLFVRRFFISHHFELRSLNISSFGQGDGKGEEKDNKTNHKTESTSDRNGSENDALMKGD